MQDEFDADGYEPEHDQYLDNDDESSELCDEDEFDEETDEAGEQDELDPDDEGGDLDDQEYGSPHWDDL